MEQEDKQLKDFLQTEKKTNTAPEDFTNKVMDRIESVVDKKPEPLVPVWVIISILALCLIFPLLATFGSDFPEENWLKNLEIQEGINRSVSFLKEYAVVGLLITTLLSFLLIDRLLRYRKKWNI